jgi:hypothetical protein
MRRYALLTTLAVSLAACTPVAFAGAPAPTSDVLFAPEIAKARVVDTYQAVSQLRPEFLEVRVPLMPTSRRVGLRVYLNDIDVGGIDALRNIPIDQVTAIRYISASDAQFRWGVNQADGVILVSTSRLLSQ